MIQVEFALWLMLELLFKERLSIPDIGEIEKTEAETLNSKCSMSGPALCFHSGKLTFGDILIKGHNFSKEGTIGICLFCPFSPLE